MGAEKGLTEEQFDAVLNEISTNLIGQVKPGGDAKADAHRLFMEAALNVTTRQLEEARQPKNPLQGNRPRAPLGAPAKETSTPKGPTREIAPELRAMSRAFDLTEEEFQEAIK